MQLNDWLIVGATLLGPILAVQAQKWVERARAATMRKNLIFDTLMATRGARVSPDHVRALNSIDLSFYGWRVLGKVYRSKGSQHVLDAWHEYHRHLSHNLENAPQDVIDRWTAAGDEIFLNLLEALARVTHHKFERDQLRTGGYTPVAHGRIEAESNILRRFALEMLAGDRPLKMKIDSWPANQGDVIAGLKELTDKAAQK